MRKIASLLFFLFMVGFGHSQTNLFLNGSFNGIVGEDHHGEGWNTGSTPDLNDSTGILHTSTGYTWVKKPVQSPDGGPWQNLYSYREFLEQRITVEKGETYTIIFNYASMPITSSGLTFDQPVGIDIYIDEELKFSSSPDTSPYTWEKACFQFKAQLGAVTIKFSASAEQYVGIDGVKLIKGNLCNRTP